MRRLLVPSVLLVSALLVSACGDPEVDRSQPLSTATSVLESTAPSTTELSAETKAVKEAAFVEAETLARYANAIAAFNAGETTMTELATAAGEPDSYGGRVSVVVEKTLVRLSVKGAGDLVAVACVELFDGLASASDCAGHAVVVPGSTDPSTPPPAIDAQRAQEVARQAAGIIARNANALAAFGSGATSMQDISTAADETSGIDGVMTVDVASTLVKVSVKADDGSVAMVCVEVVGDIANVTDCAGNVLTF